MDVSKNSGNPRIIHFNRVFHYKPSILGYPYFWKHPYVYVYIYIYICVCKWCLLILETPKSSVSSRKTWTSVGFFRLTWPKLDIFQWKVMIFEKPLPGGFHVKCQGCIQTTKLLTDPLVDSTPKQTQKKETKLPMQNAVGHIDVCVPYACHTPNLQLDTIHQC